MEHPSTSAAVPGAGDTPEHVLEFALVERIRRRRVVVRVVAAVTLVVVGFGSVVRALTASRLRDEAAACLTPARELAARGESPCDALARCSVDVQERWCESVARHGALDREPLCSVACN